MGEPEADPGLPTQAIWDIPFENLEFLERIGKGSFGSVYRGIYLGLDVAIKKIEKADDPEYLKYIDREVSMLQSIRHPFIVQFTGICVHSTGLYIVTEYVSGGDVRQYLKKEQHKFPWKTRLRVAVDLAKAMLFLHSKKIMHRDLKSKNILMDEHMRIRLADFGFARMNEAATKRARHLTMCGTEGWVAPEILLGMSYDFSCDVFSYGVVLAELATGRKPGIDLWVRTPENCYDVSLEELRSKALPGCPPRLVDVAGECCQYEPLLRPRFDQIVATINTIIQEFDAAERNPVTQVRELDALLADLPAKPPSTTATTAATATTTGGAAAAAAPGSPTLNTTVATGATTTPTTQTTAAMAIPGSASRDPESEGGGPSGADPNALATSPPQSPQHPNASTWKIGARVGPPASASRMRGFTIKDSHQYLPPHLQPAAKAAEPLLAPEGRAGLVSHVMKMVERATSDYYHDSSYNADLLLCYRCFSTPSTLMDQLVARYEATAPESLTAIDRAAWLKAHKVVQLRVIIFVKSWIDHYPADFDVAEGSPPPRLEALDRAIAPAAKDDEQMLTPILRKKREAVKELALMGNGLPGAGPVASLEDSASLELARQMTLVDAALWRAVQPREFIEYNWMREGAHASPWLYAAVPPVPAANVQALVAQFKHIARLVASDIVRATDRLKRVAQLERFIDVAEKCSSLKNFNAVFAIMAGIRHTAVERLSDTFKALSPRAQSAMDTLAGLVSKDNDFRTYREALLASSPPCIPYIEHVVDELWFLESSSPRMLKGGIVNFFHYRQISRRIWQYQQYISSSYTFPPVAPVQRVWLRTDEAVVLDDEALKRASLVCEPPAF